MNKAHNPPTIGEPIGNSYSHGIETPPGARWLHLAGQVGRTKDGQVGATIEEQTGIVWRNIEAILASAGMGIADIVKIVTYVTDPRYIPAAREVRAKHLGAHRPASTLLVVSGLADPRFFIEIEAIAAK